jgi:hypothetical protein
MREGFPPVVGDLLTGGVPYGPQEPAVADRDVGGTHRHDHFAGGLVVREIITGKPVMVFHALPLRIELCPLPRFRAVRPPEIESLRRLRHGILHRHDERVGGRVGPPQRDGKHLAGMREGHLGAVHPHLRDGHLRRVEFHEIEERADGDQRHLRLSGDAFLLQVDLDREPVVQHVVGAVPGVVVGGERILLRAD